MRIVYLGTGEIGLPTLRRLAGSPHEVHLIITQPDRPAGRGQVVRAGPVKAHADAAGIPVLQPEAVNTDEVLARVAAVRPDVLVVIAYGQFISKPLREFAPHHAVNLHPSLLPRHRGAAPCQFTLLSGDDMAGVSVIRLEKRMDAGPVLGQVATPLGAEETAGELQDRLAESGAELMVRVLDDLAAGRPIGQVQDDSAATHTRKITPEDGRIDWTRPARDIDRQIRGLSPKPGASALWIRTDGKPPEPVKVLRSRLPDGARPPSASVSATEPGTVTAVEPAAIRVACGGGGELLLRELQPAGGRVQSAADFANGRRVRPGDRFASVPAVPGC